MANYRPKSLSELNNVYDKAMRAEKAIKEGSSLLSVPEKETTPPSENIFEQLESKAQEAEKSQVFDPDITNIANDFLKRYAQPEKPKAARRDVKRPAPSIQSVSHTPAKPKQEEKQDISLGLGSSLASEIEAPAVPLHKPAPTMPAIPEPVAQPEVQPEAEVQIQQPEAPAEAPSIIITAAQTVVTAQPATDIPAESEVISKPQISRANSAKAHTPPRHVSPRVRITSTERNELMEEYMRVMSDEEEDDFEYKKPKFSFFKKKKKYEEEEPEASSTELYEEPFEEEEEKEEEVPVVAFDHSNVRYTDEYSNAPAQEDSAPLQDNMNIYDYIEADFDYSEDDMTEEDEDSSLDMSFVTATPAEDASEDAIQEEAQEASEEIFEDSEAEEIVEAAFEETAEAEKIIEEASEETAEQIIENVSEEESEEVVYPTEDIESPEEAAPYTDMVFEDVFSVSDESKRSHTGGNWEEVFGKDFKANTEEETVEDTSEEYPEYTQSSDEEYADPKEEEPTYQEYAEYEEEAEETESEDNDEVGYKASKGKTFLKFFAAFICVICILSAGATLLISSFLDVNSGNLVSDKYRVFSVSEDLAELGLGKDDLVLAENAYAHTDDLYVYKNEADGSFVFGKVTSSFTNLTGDYFYVTKGNDGTHLINRNNSMGVVIATYSGIGGILSAICQYYIYITAALLVLAVAMIVLIVLISRKKKDYDDAEVYETTTSPADDEEDDSDSNNGDDTDYSDEDSEEEYYTDFDTDGIEQGLFSNI